jgi:hypothetical protein
MPVIRSAIAAVEVTVAVVGLAITISRHPLVRAGLRAAPQLMTPAMKQAAVDAVLDGAFAAGAKVRRIVPRRLLG